MKIFPLKPISTVDKFQNLMDIIENMPKSKNTDFDQKVQILNSEFTIRDIREIYKNARQQLSHDKFCKNSSLIAKNK